MAATTAAVLSAAARRLSRSAAASSSVGSHLLSAARRMSSSSSRTSGPSSSIITREVTGHHNLRISGYSASRKAPVEWVAASQAFDAAGYRWRIKYDPNGNSWNESNECISVFVELAHDKGPYQEVKDPVQFKLSLLDADGNPSPKYCRSNDASFFVDGQAKFQDFIRWKDLEESGCLKEDSFIVRCDITVIKKWTEGDGDIVGVDGGASALPRIEVPPSDLHEYLYELLWKKSGVDVAVDVGGETFEAHSWLLAVRCPALEAELLAAPKEKALFGGPVRRRMEIGGMEPKVFKAMLHFMYTDALPASMMEEGKESAVAMARDLLAAAHRYKLERLKILCEDMLCRRIDVDTVAGTMAVAEQHGCVALEAACAEFLARPGKLKAVMETEGYEKIKANPTMMELIMKQLA